MADEQWRDQVAAWDKAYRRKRKIIILTILTILLLGAAGFFLYPTAKDFYIRSQYYNQALQLLESGQEEDAAEAFWLAGNYLDARQYSSKLNYEKAQAYLEDGRITYAAIAFGKAGDYLDAREQSFALWKQFADRTVRCASDLDVVGWIRPDGTGDFNHKKVDSTVGDYNHPGDFSSWTDLVSISVNRGNTVGTFADGTVRYITGDKGSGELKTYTPKWTNVIVAYYGWYHVIALKSDGTVCVECFACKSQCDIVKTSAQWTDIIALCGTRPLVGLKADGTLVTASCQDFADVDDIQTQRAMIRDLEAATDVVAVRVQSLGDRYVMLLADGTMRFLGEADDLYPPTSFDELVLPWYDSEAWFPANMEAMAEPPRDRAAIAASFPNQTERNAQYYQHAVSLQGQGDLAQAAIAFGKAGDYEDAAIRSMELWRQIGKLPTVAVRDGVVAALKEDGTVALADPKKQLGKNPANLNKKFVALYFCNRDLLGITPEGNVLAIGKQKETLPATTHVVRILYAHDYGIVIQKTDGSLISEKGFLPGWNNVVLVVPCHHSIAALSTDGVARGAFDPLIADDAGNIITGQPDEIRTDLAYVPSAYKIYSVTPEGRIETDDYAPKTTPASLWKGVKHIYGDGAFLYAVLENGHVLVDNSENSYGNTPSFGFEAGEWTDIVAVSACDTCVVGLKKDGTLKFAGTKALSKLQTEVKKMKGLMIPVF